MFVSSSQEAASNNIERTVPVRKSKQKCQFGTTPNAMGVQPQPECFQCPFEFSQAFMFGNAFRFLNARPGSRISEISLRKQPSFFATGSRRVCEKDVFGSPQKIPY